MTEHTLFIPVILGTGREGRKSEQVARAVYAAFEGVPGVHTEFVDVKDFPFTRTVPSWEEDETAKRWRDIVTRADGLLIVSPEYNYSAPGELKLLLDSAYSEYERKPVAIVGVSNGPYGGARMMAALRIVLVQLGLSVVRSTFLLTFVDKFIENKNTFTEDQAKNLDRVFADLLWYARTLKAGRDNLSNA